MNICRFDDQVDDKKECSESNAKNDAFKKLVIRNEIGRDWIVSNKIEKLKQVDEIPDVDEPSK